MNQPGLSSGAVSAGFPAAQIPAGWAVPAQQASQGAFLASPSVVHGVAMVMMGAGPGRDALSAALASSGFSVMAFGSPLEVAPHLYGVRPSVVLVDAASGVTMACLVGAWLRLAGLQAPLVLMGSVNPVFADQVARSGVTHCVPYPTDLGVFSDQVVVAARASGAASTVPAPLDFSPAPR
jgi:hypothetical protein